MVNCVQLKEKLKKRKEICYKRGKDDLLGSFPTVLCWHLLTFYKVKIKMYGSAI